MTLIQKTRALGVLATAAMAVMTVSMGCSPATPGAPTYAKDVAPILDAHCARCHSARGPDGGFPVDPDAKTATKTPAVCHFDAYEGASACATLMKPYIEQTNMFPMPPLPATKLSDWEIEVIERWAAHPMP